MSIAFPAKQAEIPRVVREDDTIPGGIPVEKLLVRPKKMLRILFVAAEADPIVKVGGLGDVAGSLPRALQALTSSQAMGHTIDTRLVIPYHPIVAGRVTNPELAATFTVPHPHGAIPARAFLTYVQDLPVYLIDGAPISAVPEVYGADTRKSGEKYVFFSLAVLELARALNWPPDILHAQDWHTAVSVYALKLLQDDPFFQHTSTFLSIHNLPFMGAGTEEAVTSFGLPAAHDARLPAWGTRQPLPMGLSSADVISAVSPTYAQEILTPEFGSGLQDFLQMRAGTLYGIVNGLDEKMWDPAADPGLVQNFSASSLDLRVMNKKALLDEVGLLDKPGTPLFIFIGRMDRQKGVDLALEALHQIDDLPWQAIFLGTGDPGLEEIAKQFQRAFPQQFRAILRFDAGLSRRMYAGGDILLMPSRYEPCGLAQMIAMRYGCIPVARATGGLCDTICDCPPPSDSTGFLFEQASPEALAKALRRGAAAFSKPFYWKERQLCGMKQDFSWQRSAQSYARLYLKFLN